MEPPTTTWVTSPAKRGKAVDRQACLIQIYPTGVGVGTRYELNESPILIGRDENCQVCVTEHSVSRRHAQIMPSLEGYTVSDLGSTNGTFVNDEPVTGVQALHDGDYLRIGNCIFRYLAGGNVEADYHEEIYRMIVQDGLTQVHNQRYLMEFLDRETIRTARHRCPLSLVMLDIDHFKAVNDKWGHLVGDFVLRELAQIIRVAIRREDLFARYGGEEFAVVLVESPLVDAVATADRIRRDVAEHEFRFDDKMFHITISCGVADCEGDPRPTPMSLIKRADDKLYEAKRAGRNRVMS